MPRIRLRTNAYLTKENLKQTRNTIPVNIYKIRQFLREYFQINRKAGEYKPLSGFSIDSCISNRSPSGSRKNVIF